MARDRLVVGDRGTAGVVPRERYPSDPVCENDSGVPPFLDSSHDQTTRDQPTRTGLSTVGQSPAALS